MKRAKCRRKCRVYELSLQKGEMHISSCVYVCKHQWKKIQENRGVDARAQMKGEMENVYQLDNVSHWSDENILE